MRMRRGRSICGHAALQSRRGHRPWHLHGFHTADVAGAEFHELHRYAVPRFGRPHRGFASMCPDVGVYHAGIQTAADDQPLAAWARRSWARARAFKSSPKIALPAPTEIIDTLATARRQSLECYDSRIRAVTAAYVDRLGRDDATLPASTLPELGAQASQERGSTDPKILMEADARLVTALFLMQLQVAQSDGGAIARIVPAELTAPVRPTTQFRAGRCRNRTTPACEPWPAAHRWAAGAGHGVCYQP